MLYHPNGFFHGFTRSKPKSDVIYLDFGQRFWQCQARYSVKHSVKHDTILEKLITKFGIKGKFFLYIIYVDDGRKQSDNK